MNGTALTQWIGNECNTLPSQSVSIGNVSGGTAATGDWWYQQYPYWNVWPQSNITIAATEPKYCIGKAHVFECDHERKCKCGKVTRLMPKAAKAK